MTRRDSPRLAEARAALQAARERDEAACSPSIFDVPVATPERAERERDSAIEAVTATWAGDVLDEMGRAIDRVIARRETFTADDVREELGDRVKGADTRALGGVLRSFVRAGRIVSTGHYSPSRFRHSSPLVVWRRRSPEGQR